MEPGLLLAFHFGSYIKKAGMTIILTDREVRFVKKKGKQSKQNQEIYNSEFAEEVVEKNAKQPAQNNPSEGVRK